MSQAFHVVIEQDEDGGYIGKVVELPGCLSQGDTISDLLSNIREAIELYLEVQAEEKTALPQEQIKFVKVEEVQV